MSEQLKRKFNGEMDYCEAIKKNKYEAEQYAKKVRTLNVKVRIVKVADGYACFERSSN